MQHYLQELGQGSNLDILTDEWIKKSHTYTQEYYLLRKRNRSVVVRWMNLESVIQSDVRKTNIIY